MSLADKIFACFKGVEKFTLKQVYEKYSDKPTETIRARIYDNLGVKFKRIAKEYIVQLSPRMKSVLY